MREKSEIFCVCERTERSAGGEGVHRLTFFFSISNLFVKAALSHISLWQTQGEIDIWIF